MKFYTATLKTLVILFSVFSANLLYGGDDEFSVTVTENRSGSVNTVRICYELDQDIELSRIPSFEVSPTDVASPTFNITFDFNDQIPPDGRLFEVHGFVYIKTSSNSYTPVALNNGISYATGTSGTSQGGQVSLSVTLNFNVLSNCGYYFSFTVVDITPQMGGGAGSSTGNQETMGANSGNQNVLSPYTISSPKIVFTKDTEGCARYISDMCQSRIDGNPTNTARTSLNQANIILDIFPNPTSNRKVVLHLDFEKQISRNLNIEVLNTQGQLLKREQIHVTAAETSLKRKLDMRELPAGIYLVKVDTGTEQLIQKLVVQ